MLPDQVDPTRSPGHAWYLTLDQALGRGFLEIREKDGVDVPRVVVSNRSDRSIFIMGGIILSGCRQDRIVTRDVMIVALRKRLLLSVYCVESGRWHHISGEFKRKKNLGSSSMRAAGQPARSEDGKNLIGLLNRKAGFTHNNEVFSCHGRNAENDGKGEAK